MSDEDKLQAAANRASHAKSLLEDPLLVESLDKLDAAYVKAWRESDARDDDARQRLWLAVNVIGKVRDHLTRIVSNGKLAQAQINALAKREKQRTRAS